MKLKLHYIIFIISLILSSPGFAQNVSLYQQFNGHYDFVFFGNTLNTEENGLSGNCNILTSSAATLALHTDDEIEKAYLYWAGSGNGDFNVKLNGQDIVAQRNFSLIQLSSGRPYFSAFADVTPLVQTTGTGNYILSDLDLTPVIQNYCDNGGNFGGWAIVILYKNALLPVNQINIYDGLQAVPDFLNITLDNLNVIDNIGSKIGFVAWEGDRFISVNETLTINGHTVSNALNPSDNAFNGTNGFTGSTTLYNMDLDVYNLQGFIDIGDESAEIELTSGQDFVMINTVVTKFNSTLPDATIAIDNIEVHCNSQTMLVDYTVSNTNGTQALPAQTKIAIYIGGQLIATAQTVTKIAVGQSENAQIAIAVPETTPDDFELRFVVDDDGNGQGAIIELDENNNTFARPVHFLPVPQFNPLAEVNSCNEGFGKGTYDFSDYAIAVKVNPADTVSFYETAADAQNETNAIPNPQNYQGPGGPMEIFVRLENELGCYAVTSFFLISKNCPPTVYNYISANNDGFNDDFFIRGLRNIFLNFKLSIYNRWGALVWVGNNNLPNWTGENNQKFIPNEGGTADGTYFYILELNDVDYPEPLQGFLYLNR